MVMGERVYTEVFVKNSLFDALGNFGRDFGMFWDEVWDMFSPTGPPLKPREDHDVLLPL